MSAAVTLSQLMGVSGCGLKSSTNVSLTLRPYFISMKIATNSASAADNAKHFKIVQRVKIAPLSVMVSPYLETEPRKKCPYARLLALFADR